MVIDCVTYNGEADILEIRLNVLDEYVDQFIIVEFDKTFSGKDKPAYYLQHEKRFEKWSDKIKYINFRDVDYLKYKALAESSPNTQGAEHWKTEFMMKECIKDALAHLNDDDIVFIGDVDEIWNPLNFEKVKSSLLENEVYKIIQLVYVYNLNNKSNEPWAGTIISQYKNIKDKCLNHIRSNKSLSMITSFSREYGWHFTSMGGYEEVKRKLNDSYTEETYNNPIIQANLQKNISEVKDFLNRPFTYSIDESDWPQYLKDNREKYKHLLKM